MIKGLVRKLAERRIQKNLTVERQVKIVNLHKAQNIAFLVNLNDKQFYLEYRKLVNEIESKNKKATTHALGWYRGKKLPDYVKPNEKLSVFNTVDYSFLFKPKKKSDTLKKFLLGEYDLLIDMTQNDIYPLRKILSLTKSTFKVGTYEIGNEPFYDFMIKYRNLKDYTIQLVHYLTLFNKYGEQ